MPIAPRRPLITLTALALAATASPLLAQAADVAPTASSTSMGQASLAQAGKGSNLEGTVSFSGCSGALVRYTTSRQEDKAMIMTNGHCMQPGAPKGQAMANKPSRTMGNLLDARGGSAMKLQTTTLLYGTEAKTDVALYEVSNTYAEIIAKTKIDPFVIAATAPTVDTKIYVPSSYWKIIYNCSVDKLIYKLKENGNVWPGALRYAVDTTGTCTLKGGTSGSPIVSQATGEIIGINNTGDDGGPLCGDMGPCEEDEQGTITRGRKEGYGTRLEWFYTCLDANNKLDFSKAGCELIKPSA